MCDSASIHFNLQSIKALLHFLCKKKANFIKLELLPFAVSDEQASIEMFVYPACVDGKVTNTSVSISVAIDDFGQ